MSRPKNSTAQQLNAAGLAIANSLADPDIQAAVAAFGYPTEKLEQGRRLLEAAQTAVAAQGAAAGAQQSATRQMRAAWKAAQEAYQALAKVARAVYGDDRARLTALGLSGRMPQDTAGFSAAAALLFDNARDLPELAGYGFDPARLAAGRAQVEAFRKADELQEAAKGAAQTATARQEAALARLEAWIAQYLKIARVALRQDPQQLEKLGVLARSSRAPARRKAKAAPPGPDSAKG